MSQTNELLRLELENMTPEKCLALAQFVKRLGFSEIKGCAVDEAETYVMRDAINELQKALDAAGYSPQ